MRFVSLLAGACIAALVFSPAVAGDKVLEGKAPPWVQEASLPSGTGARNPAQLISDSQYRLEDGTVVSYFDTAVRIDNADALMDQNTLSLSWAPDKGDLTVHRLEIVRDGKTIDLLAAGAKFEVIRREQGLESKLLDGELTATLSIPGLRVGDILRTTYSTSLHDQALGERMQVLEELESAPWRVGLGRVIVSWPQDARMAWKAEELAALSAPTLREGYRYLTVALPLPEAKDMPADAPVRYRRPAVLRVGSFASWKDLSSVMAPHFVAAATVADDSEVAKQAAAIMKQSADPLERAQIATRLVQDKVSYLLNGLDGGNYLPQAAGFTWDKRYGDCKAKTVLLLALLKRMGIEAEPALVASAGGDALPELLPIPGDFDHVIVHATIAGRDYWLDGTSIGTRMYNLADIPAFGYALPLRVEGADLVPMVQRDKTYPDMKIVGVTDMTAGVDFPQVFELTMEMSGPAGARAEAMADAADPDMLRRLASTFAESGGAKDGVLSALSVTYDKDTAIARVKLKGVAASDFGWKDGKLVVSDSKMTSGAAFNPDRAKREWRDIPVATRGPTLAATDLTVLLPQGGKGFALGNTASADERYANTRVAWDATIDGPKLHTSTRVWQAAGEVAPDAIPAAKRDALRIAAMFPKVTTPSDITWRWDLDDKQRMAKARPILEAYDEAIRFALKDDHTALTGKAKFLASIYRFDDALKIYGDLIDKEPAAWVFNARAGVLAAMGRRAEAIADLRESYDLEPSNGVAFELAEQLAYAGKEDEGLKLLEGLPVGEDEAADYASTWATVAALKGDTAGGLDKLAAVVADKPEDSTALNYECWFRGLFNTAIDTALPGCTHAIERAAEPAAALDSRALIEFRMKNYAAALADYDSVLKLSPEIASSRYMRGIVRLETGDSAGAADIAAALTMAPNIREFYARHGIAAKP